MIMTGMNDNKGKVIKMQEYYLPLIKLQAVKEKDIPYGKKQICNPENVAAMAREVIGSADREFLLVICVDSRMYPVSVEVVSIGTLDNTVANPREIFKHAVLCSAYGIILSHNHPSGNVEPSRDDLKMTKRMKHVGKILGIPVLDHVIIGEDTDYRSIREMKEWND